MQGPRFEPRTPQKKKSAHYNIGVQATMTGKITSVCSTIRLTVIYILIITLASRDAYEVINSLIFNNQTFKHNINLLIWNRHLNK